MKSKKDLKGRVTLMFPIDGIHDNILPFMGHLCSELVSYFVIFLQLYAKDHPEESDFINFINENGLEKESLVDDLGNETEVSRLFAYFCCYFHHHIKFPYPELDHDYDPTDPCDGCMKPTCLGCPVSELGLFHERINNDE